MIQQRLIEKVVVPSNKKKSLSKSVKCFRLVRHELPTSGETTLVLSDADEDLDDLVNGNVITCRAGHTLPSDYAFSPERRQV